MIGGVILRHAAFSKHLIVTLPLLCFVLYGCFSLSLIIPAVMAIEEPPTRRVCMLQTATASHISRPEAVQWNLGSRTPLFTNNSVHEQISDQKSLG
jgi:hypothetical protein